MHDERSCPCRSGAQPPPGLDDANAERGVLTLVLGDYPEVYTEPELIRSVAFDAERFIERDMVERAIRSLRDVGLLHRAGPLIFPSRAALRFEALEQEADA
jgi:hypothetical protein